MIYVLLSGDPVECQIACRTDEGKRLGMCMDETGKAIPLKITFNTRRHAIQVFRRVLPESTLYENLPRGEKPIKKYMLKKGLIMGHRCLFI